MYKAQRSRNSLISLLSGFVLASTLAACATSHAPQKSQHAAKKHRKRGNDFGYGLYSAGNVNKRLLRQGQKVNGTNALGEY